MLQEEIFDLVEESFNHLYKIFLITEKPSLTEREQQLVLNKIKALQKNLHLLQQKIKKKKYPTD